MEVSIVHRGQSLVFKVHLFGSDNEDAVPVVAFHGFGGSGADFELMATCLGDSVRIIAPDLIGHGGTVAPGEPVSYTMEACVEQIRCVLECVEVRQPIVLGYSMGGRVALHYAHTHGEQLRGLVLVGATPGLSETLECERRVESDERLASWILEVGVQHFAAWWEDTPIIATQERIPEPYRTALLKRRRANQPIGLVNSLRSMGTGAMPCLWGRLSQIGIPTFLAVGDDDSKFAEIAERMLVELPQANFRSIPDAGHAAHLESSRAFAAALLPFLRGLV